MVAPVQRQDLRIDEGFVLVAGVIVPDVGMSRYYISSAEISEREIGAYRCYHPQQTSMGCRNGA